MRSLHHRDHRHLGWDASFAPAVTVAPGDEVELDLIDCFDGRLPAHATPEDVLALDPDASNPLTGPIAVDGAVPGDTLLVELLDVEVDTVGWTAVIPGFGLLADDFPQAHVVVSRRAGALVDFGRIGRLPVRPMVGTLGCAPAGPGRHPVIPPRRVGGNLDCRDVRAGARLLLPVEVPGALLSAGDAHATQGDGEVCGTGIETAARIRLRIDVRHDVPVTAPQIELPAGHPDATGRRAITTGVDTDLMAGARAATRAMIDRLVADHGLTPADAYAFCSVAGHLRLIEVVDAPNWVVAMDVDLDPLG